MHSRRVYSIFKPFAVVFEPLSRIHLPTLDKLILLILSRHLIVYDRDIFELDVSLRPPPELFCLKLLLDTEVLLCLEALAFATLNRRQVIIHFVLGHLTPPVRLYLVLLLYCPLMDGFLEVLKCVVGDRLQDLADLLVDLLALLAIY